MKPMRSLLALLIGLFSAVLVMAPPSPAAEAPAMTVGRITHMEGELLRFVPEQKDWVAVVPDAPCGVEDTLFSGSNGMAELIVPNGIWIRIGNGTQIQFIRLDADLAEMDVASGTARFFSKGKAVVRATSDFGYVLADPGTVFDLYVGENAVEVVAIKGTVSFVHAANNARYEAVAGAASVLADPQQVSLGNGTVDPEWNRWNMDRENVWLARDNVKGPSAEYLPPDLRNEAYSFEENGRWERVPYEGEDRWFWRPTVVAVDWSPFTVGHWTDWYGDQTWIPAEPFGYVTHHYGNWIFARNHWYWAPPVVGVHIGLPLLDIGFFWYPGRVAWIHSGIHVGWVPLAPRETYYSHRHWGGPHTVVVNKTNINRININVRDHAYVDHAVIVPRDQFHGRDDYRRARVPHIDRAAIVNQYRAAPVVNDRVIKNYSQSRQRFDFTNAPVPEKPHNAVTNRIRQNEKIIHEGQKEKASVLQERMKGLPEGKINRDARVEQPRGVNPIVPAKEINRPKAELKLPQREIKGSNRSLPTAGPGQSARPAERSAPAGPIQTAPTTPKTERVAPTRPGQPVQPARPSGQAIPAKPAQPAQTSPVTERVAPAQPAQPAQPARPGDRATPARPAQPSQTTSGSGQIAPAQAPKSAERATPARPAPPLQTPSGSGRVAPVQPSQPATPAERAMPPVPTQSTPAVPKTERVTPVQPTQPARPAQPAQPSGSGQIAPARSAQTPARPELVAPAQPAQPTRPSERVLTPASPPQTTQPAPPARPAERVVTPTRSARPAQTSPVTERVVPAQPAQPAQPARPAERVTPARPAQPAPTAPKAERAAPTQPAQPQSAPEQTLPQPEPKEKKSGHR